MKRISAFIVLTMLTASGVMAAVMPPVPWDPSFGLVHHRMLVSTEWLAENLEAPEIVVVHVAREKSHFDEGHIPGARFLQWGQIAVPRNGAPNMLAPVDDLVKVFENLGIGNDTRIILYGDLNGLAATRAYFTLDYLGHGNRVSVLDGGLEKWKSENRPISTQASAYQPAEFKPYLNPGVVVEMDVMQDLSWAAVNVPDSVVIIDARPEDQYTGEVAGEDIPRAGHIPGSKSIFWMRNVQSESNPVMRSVDELREMYRTAGASSARRVVVYCRTGGQASHAYFTSKYLGYNVTLFDGSYHVWSNTDGTPVETGQGSL